MFNTRNHKIFNLSTIENYYKVRIEAFKYASLLILSWVVFALSALAQTEYPLVRTAMDVSPNYTLPKNVLKPDEPLTIAFSQEPKDEEIFRAHFFEEPLVPLEGKVSGFNTFLGSV